MPVSILALLDLARSNRLTDGRVEFTNFEPAFRKLMAAVAPKSAAKAWLPFYHLSGRVGLWSLHGPGDLPDGWKPTGRSGLTRHVTYAQLSSELAKALDDPNQINAIESAIVDMLEDDGKPASAALARLRRSAATPA